MSCKSTTASLSDKQYTLTELNGTQLEKVDVTPSISFAKGRVNATVGCNQIFADYKVSKDGKNHASQQRRDQNALPPM
ncbi:MAG: META domain-containing protein [Porphyromonadaceae bacterium]|nr:MAG: META domain-containing protein [Porphyromonadaceae bacterium]